MGSLRRLPLRPDKEIAIGAKYPHPCSGWDRERNFPDEVTRRTPRVRPFIRFAFQVDAEVCRCTANLPWEEQRQKKQKRAHVFTNIPRRLCKQCLFKQCRRVGGGPREWDRVEDALLKSLGRRIRDLRMKQGYSQEAFADLCGVHRTFNGNRGTRRIEPQLFEPGENREGALDVYFGSGRRCGEGTGRNPSAGLAEQDNDSSERSRSLDNTCSNVTKWMMGDRTLSSTMTRLILTRRKFRKGVIFETL